MASGGKERDGGSIEPGWKLDADWTELLRVEDVDMLEDDWPPMLGVIVMLLLRLGLFRNRTSGRRVAASFPS